MTNTQELRTAVDNAHAAAAAGQTDVFADALLDAYDAALACGRGDVEEALEALDPDDCAGSVAALAAISNGLAR